MDNNNRNLKENLGERFRRGRESLDEFRAESQAKARRVVRYTDNYAHDHPWNLVAGASALALIAGLLMRGGGSRKIVVRKPADAPVLKVKKVSGGTRGWEVISALVPVALFAVKAYYAKSAAAAAAPNPVVDTSTPVM